MKSRCFVLLNLQGADGRARSTWVHAGRPPLADNGEQTRFRDLQPAGLIFAFFFLFQPFSLVRHHAPTAGQIEVRSSKHVIGYLGGVTAALIGPSPTFISTGQHHGGLSPGRILSSIHFCTFLLGRSASVRTFVYFSGNSCNPDTALVCRNLSTPAPEFEEVSRASPGPNEPEEC